MGELLMSGDTKIGLLIPCTNTTMEEEFNRALLPKNITVHAARLRRSTTDLTIETLSEMESSIEDALSLMGMIDLDVVIFGCTSASQFLGRGWDDKIIERMKKLTNAAVTTTATCVIEALKRLDMKKIGVITPYIDKINEREKDFLQTHGFEVAFIDGFRFLDSLKIPKVTSSQLLAFIKKCSLSDVDGLFISCTNLKTFGVIDEVEKAYSIPVVTSNQASLWNALRITGKREGFDTLGKLCSLV
jgi:maleate isomerase